jgi:hypothetical protein
LIAVVDVGRIGGSADEGFMAEGCQSLPSKGLERDWNGSRVMVRDGEIASRSEGRRARAVSLRHQDVLDSFLQCLTALMVSEGADDGWNDSISMGMIQFRCGGGGIRVWSWGPRPVATRQVLRAGSSKNIIKRRRVIFEIQHFSVTKPWLFDRPHRYYSIPSSGQLSQR